MKVSIVIPVYEEEKYLRDCLDSVIYQTYSDLEIIVIDDGSKDSCPQIIREYEQRDNRVVAIYKENEGAGPTRNRGIEIATGDYITFLDCDDWLDLDCIEQLVKVAKSDLKLDLITWGHHIYDGIEKSVKHVHPQKYDNGAVYVTDVLLGKAGNSTGNLCKFYRLDIFRNNPNLRYRSFRCAQDGLFNTECLEYINRVQIIDYCGYYYRKVQVEYHETRAAKTDRFYEMQIECAVLTANALERACICKKIDKNVYYPEVQEFRFIEFSILYERILFDNYVKSSLRQKRRRLSLLISSFSPADFLSEKEGRSWRVMQRAIQKQNIFLFKVSLYMQPHNIGLLISLILCQLFPRDTKRGKMVRFLYNKNKKR